MKFHVECVNSQCVIIILNCYKRAEMAGLKTDYCEEPAYQNFHDCCKFCLVYKFFEKHRAVLIWFVSFTGIF